MLNKNQISVSIGLVSVFCILYSAVLGSNGILERRTLENRLNTLREEVERLETENMNLEAKKKFLRDDETALAREARKYYLLSEDSKVIKFKETISNESNDRLFASGLPNSHLKKKDTKEHLPPVNMLKFFYIVGAGAVLIGVFMKFK
ncbi:MAG TPA: septum formation initiator family protein [Leptospiraceae bacterium]|nr:septum formation initiator family protein [Leptospiraceae bacterium]HRG73111.1 septum formation initiator family protein [Leptospiraceae bacterium]